MPQNSSSSEPDSASASTGELPAALRAHLPCLEDITLPNDADAAQKVAQSLGIMVQILKRLEQTLYSQLEVMGKNHAPIKTMAETLQNQGLLDVEQALGAVLGADSTRTARLTNYGDLLLRWSSAAFAGVQTTVMEVPNELIEALNPANWTVEKKRWSGEDQAYWNHYKIVVRHEVPLKIGDRLKSIQAEKTLEAYSVLGSGQMLREQEP